MTDINELNLWKLFEMAELTKVMQERGKAVQIVLLKRLRYVMFMK